MPIKRISQKKLDDYITQKIQPLFSQIVHHYGDTCDQAMKTPYSWSGAWGVTYRKNQEIVVGNYRNIVDLGDLLSSRKVTIDGLNAHISWSADHAAKVFFGSPKPSGGFIPGRNWVERANKTYQTIF